MAQFDVVLHLIGEQNIPNYIAIKHLDAEKHILLATNRTKTIAERLCRVLQGVAVTEIRLIEAYDVKLLKEGFATLVQSLQGKRVAANVTGGTKPMAILLSKALDALAEGCLYYIETGEKKELLLLSAETARPLNPCILDIQTFVALQRDNPLSEERPILSSIEYRLAKSLWSERARESFQWKVNNFAQLADRRGKQRLEDVKREYDHFKGILHGSQAEQDLAAYYNEMRGDLHRLCEFLGGKWLEVYVYTQISESKKLMKAVRDLRMNVRLLSVDSKTKDHQELDLAYTDAFYLYILECKSGNVTQEDIQKLENNVRNYGGTYGRGVLITAKALEGMALERVRMSRNIMLVEGSQMAHLVTALQNWKSGRYIPS